MRKKDKKKTNFVKIPRAQTLFSNSKMTKTKKEP